MVYCMFIHILCLISELYVSDLSVRLPPVRREKNTLHSLMCELQKFYSGRQMDIICKWEATNTYSD